MLKKMYSKFIDVVRLIFVEDTCFEQELSSLMSKDNIKILKNKYRNVI